MREKDASASRSASKGRSQRRLPGPSSAVSSASAANLRRMVYTFQGLQNKRARARLTRFVGEGKPLVGALLGVRLVLERQRQPRTSFLLGRLLAEIEGPAVQSGNTGDCGMAPPECLVWVSVHAASLWLGLDVAIPWIHLFPLVTCADCEMSVCTLANMSLVESGWRATLACIRV
jgi:hypothetical protein